MCFLCMFQADAMMSCPLPIVPVIQPLPTLNSQTDFPIHIGIKVSCLNIPIYMYSFYYGHLEFCAVQIDGCILFCVNGQM